MGLFNFGRKYDGTIEFLDFSDGDKDKLKAMGIVTVAQRYMNVILHEEQLECVGKGIKLIIPTSDLRSINRIAEDPIKKYSVVWKDGLHAVMCLNSILRDGYISGENWITSGKMDVIVYYSFLACDGVILNKRNVEEIIPMPSNQFFRYKIVLQDGHWGIANLRCELDNNFLEYFFKE